MIKNPYSGKMIKINGTTYNELLSSGKITKSGRKKQQKYKGCVGDGAAEGDFIYFYHLC